MKKFHFETICFFRTCSSTCRDLQIACFLERFNRNRKWLFWQVCHTNNRPPRWQRETKHLVHTSPGLRNSKKVIGIFKYVANSFLCLFHINQPDFDTNVFFCLYCIFTEIETNLFPPFFYFSNCFSKPAKNCKWNCVSRWSCSNVEEVNRHQKCKTAKIESINWKKQLASFISYHIYCSMDLPVLGRHRQFWQLVDNCMAPNLETGYWNWTPPMNEESALSEERWKILHKQLYL